MRRILWIAMLGLLAACTTTGGTAGSGTPADAAAEEDGMVWTTRAYPTGDARTSALLVRRGLPREIQSGQRYDYVIEVRNLTGQTITDVVLSDTAPPEFRVPEEAPPAQTADGRVTWLLGDLEGGASATVRGSGLAGQPGEYRHVCHVSWRAPLYGATLVTLPRLALTKTVPGMVVLADGVTFVYEITNEGTGTARDVSIEEQLPEGLKTREGDDSVRIEVGAVPAGETKVFKVECSAASTGEYTGRATATGFGGLEAASEDVSVKVTQPVLEIAVQAPGRAAIGQIFTQTITVSNLGDGPCRDLTVQQTVLEGSTLVEASDGGALQGGLVRWRLGTLEPGAEKAVTLRLRALQAATLDIETRAMGHGAASVAAANRTEMYGIATLALEVGDLADPVEVGQEVTYIVTVTNQGTAAGTNLTLACTVEEGMVYVSSTGPTAGSATGSMVNFSPVATLEPKATLTWSIVIRADEPGDRRFRAALTGDQFARPVESAESTKFFK